MVWESYDTIGLISLIAGVVLLFVPFFNLTVAVIVWLSGGAAVLIMGIVAVSNDSKLGIGGIICGSLLILIGVVYLFQVL